MVIKINWTGIKSQLKKWTSKPAKTPTKNQPQPKTVANSIYQTSLKSLETSKTTATNAINKVGTAFKEVLTDSITAIYKLGIIVAFIAFLMTLALPEIPLRQGGGFTSPAAEWSKKPEGSTCLPSGFLIIQSVIVVSL